MSSNNSNSGNGGTSWYYQQYDQQYQNWVPWIEEKYLAWFGENKSSYLAKENISSRGQVNTGVEPVNKLQDGVAEVAGGQLGKGGLLGGVGDFTSKEGVDRTERGQTGVIDPTAAPGLPNQDGQGAGNPLSKAGETLSGMNPLGSSKK